MSSGGAYVKQQREDKLLSQEELAAEANVGLPALRKIEQGKVTMPHPQTLLSLDNFFGATGSVFEAFGAKRPPGLPTAVNQPDDEAAALRRVVHVVGRSVEQLMQDAVDDGREEYAELLDELRVALRAAE